MELAESDPYKELMLETLIRPPEVAPVGFLD
jgi:hypothetical protein